MKKIFIQILLILSMFSFGVLSSYAEEGIQVTVTERIPGAGCDKGTTDDNGNILYKCTVKPGFGSVVEMMGNMIKYFTFIAGLAGVLFIVINGIMYSMGGADPSMKDEAKKRITGTLVGLVVLFMSGVILNIIAPWIYK
ncbi:hypothetical protein A9Q91_05925 [Candidatus Gracilibacteria bacterium 28_42_T64]|nr:hypothetical protein A9Q91_05925 [Candidatus Gracilibacteria bacterium 28_42_T64]